MIGRDGQTEVSDPNMFAAEWQIRDDEAMLFNSASGPQFPEVCQLPDASAAKVYGSEGFIEVYRRLGEIVGQAHLLRTGSPQVSAEAGRIERLYRTASIITFGGGTNEIQRDIISAAGLWMPRASR